MSPFASSCAMARNDIHQSRLDILRHAFGVAAHVEVRALRQPAPQGVADFTHAVLDVEFPIAIARPRQREARERAAVAQRVELFPIEEVCRHPLVPEKQPAFAGGLDRRALLQEGAERRDSRPRPNHDDRRRRISREGEIVRLLHINAHALANARPLGEKRGRDAEPPALADDVANRVNRQRQAQIGRAHV